MDVYKSVGLATLFWIPAKDFNSIKSKKNA